jgi:hypothetical protein
MKSIVFTIFFSCTTIFSKSQNVARNLIGKWYSIDGKNIALAFTSTIERKYHVKKGVKRVPDYNIEEAQISINGDILNEKQPGGGGIDVTHKFNISNDTLIIYYRNNTIKYSFKKISEKEFQLLTGRKF